MTDGMVLFGFAVVLITFGFGLLALAGGFAEPRLQLQRIPAKRLGKHPQDFKRKD